MRGITVEHIDPRRFGVQVGELVAKMLSDTDIRFIGSAIVIEVADAGVLLDTGEAVEGELVVSASDGEVVGVLSATTSPAA